MTRDAKTTEATWLQPLLLMVAVAALAAAACDDGPPPLDEDPAGKKRQVTVNPQARAVAAKLTKKLSEKKAETAEVEVSLSETDFVESSSNRDPFRSFIGMFSTTTAATVKLQRRVLLRKYSLDELKLTAIISGSTRPVAMFVDPKKKGITVKRGDYISKSEGRIKQILPDKVIIEIAEKAEGQSSRTDRVLRLHEKSSETEEDGEYETLR